MKDETIRCYGQSIYQMQQRGQKDREMIFLRAYSIYEVVMDKVAVSVEWCLQYAD